MELNDWIGLGQELIVDAYHPGLDFLNAFVEDRTLFKLVFEDGSVKELESGREAGIGLTGVAGTHTRFFSSSTPSRARDGLAQFKSGAESEQDPDELAWMDRQVESQVIKQDLSGRPEERKLEPVRRADQIARQQDERISQVRVMYSEKKRTIAVLDLEGRIKIEPQSYINFTVMAIAEEGDLRERGYGRLAGYAGEEIFEKQSPEELAEEAANQAITALEATPVKAGPYTVVIGPGFGGTIFHEACGHGFEADHIYEGVSTYSDQMGESVASDLVTFVDDATLNNHYGSFCFDDEGTKASRSVLIREGIMEGIMSDLKYSKLLDIAPSGNGRRESFRYPTLPRMTNTFIERGRSTPDDIIENTDEGIYAKHIGGGQVDPATGDFIFSVTEGYRIENGKVTSPVRNAALVGNGPEVLKRVDAVADDLEFTPGVCGKGQWVPVCVGQPTLRVQNLTVGGD